MSSQSRRLEAATSKPEVHLRPWLPLIRMDENVRKKMNALFGREP